MLHQVVLESGRVRPDVILMVGRFSVRVERVLIVGDRAASWISFWTFAEPLLLSLLSPPPLLSFSVFIVRPPLPPSLWSVAPGTSPCLRSRGPEWRPRFPLGPSSRRSVSFTLSVAAAAVAAAPPPLLRRALARADEDDDVAAAATMEAAAAEAAGLTGAARRSPLSGGR